MSTYLMPLESGYVFELEADTSMEAWKLASADCWAIEVYKPTGEESELGRRRIDDVVCLVFLCPDGVVRAVNQANCRVV